MTNTVVTYPVPAYFNVPIESQFYSPTKYFISAIILGVNTLVTTTIDHDYVVGQLIRLIIPQYYGTRQLNEQQAYVVSIPQTNQVLLDISSVSMDPFVDAMLPTQAQILAIGLINQGVINSQGRINVGTYIPGSFINISPN